MEIQASVPGSGDGTNTVPFEPWLYKERAGLLLLNGVVYTAWSSHCDSGNYHGWIIGYDAKTLQQSAVFSDTPDWDAGVVLARRRWSRRGCESGDILCRFGERNI